MIALKENGEVHEKATGFKTFCAEDTELTFTKGGCEYFIILIDFNL